MPSPSSPSPPAVPLSLGDHGGPRRQPLVHRARRQKIGEINPTTHAITEFAIPTANSSPNGITAGPDGNLWFTEAGSEQIGMINPTTHAITEFAVPTASAEPDGITAGPDGNLWFTEDWATRSG